MYYLIKPETPTLIDHFDANKITAAAKVLRQNMFEYFKSTGWNEYNLKSERIARQILFDNFAGDAISSTTESAIKIFDADYPNIRWVRKTVQFDKNSLSKSKNILKKLRLKGSLRLHDYKQTNKIKITDGLKTLLQTAKKFKIESGVFTDYGCGESPDPIYMANKGYTSYGIDCFPLEKEFAASKSSKASIFAKDYYGSNPKFVLADVCKLSNDIPCADLILCYGVAPLVSRFDRRDLYDVISRKLNKNGLALIWLPWFAHGLPMPEDLEFAEFYFKRKKFDIVSLQKGKEYIIIKR